MRRMEVLMQLRGGQTECPVGFLSVRDLSLSQQHLMLWPAEPRSADQIWPAPTVRADD
jgi:hypothetical protein